MRHYQGVSRLRFNTEFAMETKTSFRGELIAALRVARILVKTGTESMNRKGNKTIVECKNQLALLDAMHYGFIRPVLGQE